MKLINRTIPAVPGHSSTALLFLSLTMIFSLIQTISSISTPAHDHFLDYCGVPPFRTGQRITDLPELSKKSRLLGAKLTDFYSILRHGARTPLRANCFENMAEYASQPWDAGDCPYSTLAAHTGLMGRRRTPTSSSSSSSAPSTPRLYTFPVHPLPNKEELPGQCFSGQLTQAGVMAAYHQGWRVGSYLNKTLSPDQFVLDRMIHQSTDSHRTRETAQSFLTGIFDWMGVSAVPTIDSIGASSSPSLSASSLSASIPILGWADEDVDLWKISTNVCNTAEYINESYNDPQWLKYNSEIFSPLQDELRVKLNQTTGDGNEMSDFYDCSKTHFCAGENFPKGADLTALFSDARGHFVPTNLNLKQKSVPPFLARNATMMKRIEQAMGDYWRWPLFEYDPIRGPKLMAGGHLHALSLLFKSSLTKAPLADGTLPKNTKIYTIVGHDHGPMMTFLTALQLKPFAWPGYASMMNFEFWTIPSSSSSSSTPPPKVTTSIDPNNNDSNQGVQYIPYIRFIWDNRAVVPDYCQSQALNDELCPASVVIEYLLTILPSADDCPGIKPHEEQLHESAVDLGASYREGDPVARSDPHEQLRAALYHLDQHHIEFNRRQQQQKQREGQLAEMLPPGEKLY